jgi:hypothetical protein
MEPDPEPYLWVLTKGAGSRTVPRTNNGSGFGSGFKSGFGSRRPKNIRILRIQLRISIYNTNITQICQISSVTTVC